MRVSLCVWLMMLPTLVFSGQVSSSRKAVPVWTPEQIDNAWIRVPWSHGGYYYHNTLTREDQDHHPVCRGKRLVNGNGINSFFIHFNYINFFQISFNIK